MTKAPTVEDVARAAGVSRQTVSNALNSPEIVRPATRERVERAIAELGYRPHAAARRLRTRRSSTLGVRLDPYSGGVSGVVLDRFVHALTERASERGLRILLYAARTPDEEIDRMRELLDGGEIDAVVLTGTFRGDPRTAWLAAQGAPFVSFGRPWDDDAPSHSWVDVDGAAGTRMATEWALAHAGPRVAFLGWPTGSDTGDDRERGWHEAMDRRAPLLRLTALEAVGPARQTVADALRTDGDRLDAIVCASDTLAIGAHLAVVAAGRPTLPIIGFDNTPAAEAMGLSTVEQRPEDVAAGTLTLLAGETGGIVGPAPRAAHVLVEPRLVVRSGSPES